MSEKGLEPSRITPYAPETYVSTNFTTPTKQLLFNFHNLCWFAVVKSALALLSQNVTFSHLLFGRVPTPTKQLLFNFHNLCWFAVVKSAPALLSQNVTFSHLLFGRVPTPTNLFYFLEKLI